MVQDLFKIGCLTPQPQSVNSSRLVITQLAGQRCLVRRNMEIFYWISAGILGAVLVSWVANKLPMELPEDEDEKDWSKL
jgi:hypothetical protein